MRAPLLLLAVLGCGNGSAPVPQNVSTSSTLRVDPTQPLGWLAFATTPTRNDDDIVPAYVIASAHPLITLAPPTELPPTASVLGPTGGITPFKVGAAAKVLYGCDGNALEVTTLDGPRLTPGVAWILPPAMPPGWSPAPLPIVADASSATQRRYAIGPLTFALARTGDHTGTLTIARDARTIHTAPFERHLMEGADRAPIDLASGGPGIPEPVAAWAIAPDGPVLLTVLQPGYEGSTLSVLLVEGASARPIESLSTYLYYCAF
ncbi:MAG: hypothetical protein JWP01_3933 [Myxococcales bacterium]|nr:hypothetical protein [Myxococcales bacterium]